MGGIYRDGGLEEPRRCQAEGGMRELQRWNAEGRGHGYPEGFWDVAMNVRLPHLDGGSGFDGPRR